MESLISLKFHLKSHRAPITALAWHPLGAQFASSSLDKSICAFNTDNADHTRCLKFEPHSEEINDIDWSPKGDLIASVSKDRVVNVFQPQLQNSSCKQFIAHLSNIRSVNFNSTGRKLITASDDKTIKLWKVSHKNFITSFTGHTNWVRCARFSPDDKLIASCSDDKTVKIFNPSTGECLHTFKEENSSGVKVAWHPNSSLLAVALNKTEKVKDGKATKSLGSVKIFDFKAKKLIQYYRIFDDKLNSIDFDPSGNFMLAGVENGTTKILDLIEGREIYTLAGHIEGVTAVKFNKEGTMFLTASKDKHIMLWKFNLKNQIFDSEDSSESSQLKPINKQQNKENGDIGNGDKSKFASICIDARASDRYKRPTTF